MTRDKRQRRREQWAKRRAASQRDSLQRGSESSGQQWGPELCEISMLKEAEYIVRLAQAGEARIVTLSELFLFSTPGGDAFVLDMADQFAMCLAREGQPQPYRILESPGKFTIDWDGAFSLDGDCLVIDEGGEVTYVEHAQLLAEIRSALERVRKARS